MEEMLGERGGVGRDGGSQEGEVQVWVLGRTKGSCRGLWELGLPKDMVMKLKAFSLVQPSPRGTCVFPQGCPHHLSAFFLLVGWPGLLLLSAQTPGEEQN